MKFTWLRTGAFCAFNVVLVAWLCLAVLWSYEMHASERPLLFLAALLLAAAAVVLTISDLMRLAWLKRLKAVLEPAGACRPANGSRVPLSAKAPRILLSSLPMPRPVSKRPSPCPKAARRERSCPKHVKPGASRS